MSTDAVKFLLVDDRHENLLALEALLRRDGLELFKARSATEALELLLVHDFALALLDVQMAGMDGFELAELMRGTERTRRVPIIFLTAVASDDRRRFRGYEAGAVDYLLKPVDPQILTNKARIFFELHRHRQEVARQRDELRSVAEQLASAMERLQAHRDNSPLAVVEFDAELRLTGWSKGAERLFGWNAAEMIGQRVIDPPLMQPDDAVEFATRSADMLAGRLSRGVHIYRCRRRDGSLVDSEWYSSALLSPTGALISVNAEILDITERRRAEETQKLLIAELNHRVKNTLATVQAIALHTLRHTANPSDFAANFSGRIQSVAQAHSLLSNATWRGADLAELIHDQLRLGSLDEARLKVSGPEVHLAPQLALHLALILHELGTNARKYGAWSANHGEIVLTWTIDDGLLHLMWEESGGPPVRAPARRGFGTTLIDESVKAEGGEARSSYRADGVIWEITLKLSGPPSADASMPPSSADGPADRPAPLASAAEPARSLTGRRFLIIEDEPLVALVVATGLEDAGANVDTAATVDQALQKIEGPGFDGALLDGNLHGRPVDSVAAALTRSRIPFLFISGYGRDGLPAAFKNAAVLGKPFTQEQLLEAVLQLAPPPANVVHLKSL